MAFGPLAPAVLPQAFEPPKTTALELVDKAKIERDEYRKVSMFKGQAVGSSFVVGQPRWALRGWRRDAGGGWLFQVYTETKLYDWAFLDTAYADGQQLNVTEIDRSVENCRSGLASGCTVKETVGVNLTEGDVLRLARGQGLDMKLSGKSGEVVVNVPREHFQAALIKTGVSDVEALSVGVVKKTNTR